MVTLIAEGLEGCPVSSPAGSLASPQPQLESQSVHPVEVVTEQPLVSHEPKILVELQRRSVCDLCLQHHLVEKVRVSVWQRQTINDVKFMFA